MSPITRRKLLGEAVCGSAALALGGLALGPDARAADFPLLDPAAPNAVKLKYVEDARQAKDAIKDATCGSCGLYQGRNGSEDGPCQLFPGKFVKAAGWCSSWAPQM